MSAQERLQLLEENVLDYAIFMMDTEGRITSWNVGAERILGYPESEVIGQYGRLIFLPEDRQAGVPEREMAYAVEKGRAEDERWHLRKDGSRFFASGVLTALRDESQRLRGFAKILRDLTARKQMEAERDHLYQQSLRRAEELAAGMESIQRQQAQIEALNARLQRAMIETHHRVKNNLQVIASLMDMQAMQEDALVPATEFKRLADHVLTLAAVHDILTKQAREGKAVQQISAQAVMERLIALVRSTVPTRRITAHLSDVLLPIHQATSLAIVANELISNALKYSPGDIEVSLTSEEGSALLRICDRGPGFPTDFDVLRAANTGLELVENLVRLDLHGYSRYENHPEGGGCVTVSTPM
ncbi:MAG TPA: PAS domain S-box protein [Chthonomonadaceae bacterium]|nr:PAS domain S-box protein [Chthonomonadaceae bacterium]